MRVNSCTFKETLPLPDATPRVSRLLQKINEVWFQSLNFFSLLFIRCLNLRPIRQDVGVASRSTNRLPVVVASIMPKKVQASDPAATQNLAIKPEDEVAKALGYVVASMKLLADDFHTRHGLKLFVAEARNVFEKSSQSKKSLVRCCSCQEPFWGVILTGSKFAKDVDVYTQSSSAHVIPAICHDDGTNLWVLIMDSVSGYETEKQHFLTQLSETRKDRKVFVGCLEGDRQYDGYSCSVDAFTMLRDAYREIQCGQAQNLYDLLGVDRSAFARVTSKNEVESALKRPAIPLPSFLAKTVQRIGRFIFGKDAWVRTKRGLVSLEEFRQKHVSRQRGVDKKEHRVNKYLEARIRRLGQIAQPLYAARNTYRCKKIMQAEAHRLGKIN